MGRIWATTTMGFVVFIILVWVAVDLGRVLSEIDPVNRLPRNLRVLMNPELSEKDDGKAPDM